jgi:hypothetical protein
MQSTPSCEEHTTLMREVGQVSASSAVWAAASCNAPRTQEQSSARFVGPAFFRPTPTTHLFSSSHSSPLASGSGSGCGCGAAAGCPPVTAQLFMLNATANLAQQAGGALFFSGTHPESGLAVRWAAEGGRGCLHAGWGACIVPHTKLFTGTRSLAPSHLVSAWAAAARLNTTHLTRPP